MHQAYTGRVPAVRRCVSLVGVLGVSAALAVGLWFRFTALDKKFFWLDESYVAMWTAGHSTAEAEALFDGSLRTIGEVRQLQRVDRNASMTETVAKLAAHNPENSPNHIILQRAWSLVVGDSPARLRLLSAVVSLLCFPALFWLCLEWFGSRTTAWTAVALWAVAPFHVLFAQEARSYSLLAAMTLLTAAALLRAMRVNTVGGWLLYALTATAALYTHLFFLPVIGAHAAYVAINLCSRESDGDRLLRLTGFATAAGLSLIAFSPWLLTFLTQADKVRSLSGFMSESKSLAALSWSWICSIGSVLTDFGRQSSFAAGVAATASKCLAVGALLWSWAYLVRRTPLKTWSFAILSVIVPALWLIVPDLLFGGGRSQITRYWTTGLVFVVPTIAHAIAAQLSAEGRPRRVGGRALAAIVFTVGAASCLESRRADTWWNKGGPASSLNIVTFHHQCLRQAATTINEARHPLLLVEHDPTHPDYHLHYILPLSGLIKPDCRWIGTRDTSAVEVPPDGEVFVYLSPAMIERLGREGWSVAPLEPMQLFWRAERPTFGKVAGGE